MKSPPESSRPADTATEPVRDAPAFDFYPERWLVGVAALSDAEQISYLRLLCHQWMLGDTGLPPDAAALRRLGGKGVTPAVLAKLPLLPDGRRRNARLEDIRKEQRERISKSRARISHMNAARAAVRAQKGGGPTTTSPACAPPPRIAPLPDHLQEPLHERLPARLHERLREDREEDLGVLLEEDRPEALRQSLAEALPEIREDNLAAPRGEHREDDLAEHRDVLREERVAELREDDRAERHAERRAEPLADRRDALRAEPLTERRDDALAERRDGFLTAHRSPPTPRVPEDANDAGARAHEAVASHAAPRGAHRDARCEDDSWQHEADDDDHDAREAADAAADAAAAAERAAESRHKAAASTAKATALPHGSQARPPGPQPAQIAARRPAAAPSDADPAPSLATVQAWAVGIGCPPDKAEIWWNEQEARPFTIHGRWTDRDGNAVQSPLHALTAWWRKWQANDLQRATRLNPPSSSYHKPPRPAIPRSDSANAPGRYA